MSPSSSALGTRAATIGKSNAIVIFINQLREKVGVMFGNPEVTTGGRALRFYSSVRIEVRRIETLKKDGLEIGNRVKAKVVKNKVSPPFRIAEFDLMFGEGVNREGCVLDMAVEHNIVNKSGSWFSYGDNKIGQGREGAKQFLANQPELLAEIEQLVRTRLSLMSQEAMPEPLSDDEDDLAD